MPTAAIRIPPMITGCVPATAAPVYAGGASDSPDVGAAVGPVGMTQVPEVTGSIPPVPAVPVGASVQGSMMVVQALVQFAGVI